MTFEQWVKDNDFHLEWEYVHDTDSRKRQFCVTIADTEYQTPIGLIAYTGVGIDPDEALRMLARAISCRRLFHKYRPSVASFDTPDEERWLTVPDFVKELGL